MFPYLKIPGLCCLNCCCRDFLTQRVPAAKGTGCNERERTDRSVTVGQYEDRPSAYCPSAYCMGSLAVLSLLYFLLVGGQESRALESSGGGILSLLCCTACGCLCLYKVDRWKYTWGLRRSGYSTRPGYVFLYPSISSQHLCAWTLHSVPSVWTQMCFRCSLGRELAWPLSSEERLRFTDILCHSSKRFHCDPALWLWLFLSDSRAIVLPTVIPRAVKYKPWVREGTSFWLWTSLRIREISSEAAVGR